MIKQTNLVFLRASHRRGRKTSRCIQQQLHHLFLAEETALTKINFNFQDKIQKILCLPLMKTMEFWSSCLNNTRRSSKSDDIGEADSFCGEAFDSFRSAVTIFSTSKRFICSRYCFERQSFMRLSATMGFYSFKNDWKFTLPKHREGINLQGYQKFLDIIIQNSFADCKDCLVYCMQWHIKFMKKKKLKRKKIAHSRYLQLSSFAKIPATLPNWGIATFCFNKTACIFCISSSLILS